MSKTLCRNSINFPEWNLFMTEEFVIDRCISARVTLKSHCTLVMGKIPVLSGVVWVELRWRDRSVKVVHPFWSVVLRVLGLSVSLIVVVYRGVEHTRASSSLVSSPLVVVCKWWGGPVSYTNDRSREVKLGFTTATVTIITSVVLWGSVPAFVRLIPLLPLRVTDTSFAVDTTEKVPLVRGLRTSHVT